jgi:hypothetical protein
MVKILVTSILLTLSLTSTECAKNPASNLSPAGGDESAGRPVAFQLYSGNETLPPPHQRVLTIRGRINASDVAVAYSFRDKSGVVERGLKLEGDDYRRCVEVVRNTRIREQDAAGMRMGAGSFNVTLTYEGGKSAAGVPTNRGEWEQFAADMTRAAGEPAARK